MSTLVYMWDNNLTILVYFFFQVGVATRDPSNSDLLEKQADLINYLKDHNNKLNQKLMTLNAQLRASTGSMSQN